MQLKRELTETIIPARDVREGMTVGSQVVAKTRTGKIRDARTGDESDKSYTFLSYPKMEWDDKASVWRQAKSETGRPLFYSDMFDPAAKVTVWR